MPPDWVWATLLMTGFVALSVFTMVLARVLARNTPPATNSKITTPEPEADDEAAGGGGPPDG